MASFMGQQSREECWDRWIHELYRVGVTDYWLAGTVKTEQSESIIKGRAYICEVRAWQDWVRLRTDHHWLLVREQALGDGRTGMWRNDSRLQWSSSHPDQVQFTDQLCHSLCNTDTACATLGQPVTGQLTYTVWTWKGPFVDEAWRDGRKCGRQGMKEWWGEEEKKWW